MATLPMFFGGKGGGGGQGAAPGAAAAGQPSFGSDPLQRAFAASMQRAKHQHEAQMAVKRLAEQQGLDITPPKVPGKDATPAQREAYEHAKMLHTDLLNRLATEAMILESQQCESDRKRARDAAMQSLAMEGALCSADCFHESILRAWCMNLLEFLVELDRRAGVLPEAPTTHKRVARAFCAVMDPVRASAAPSPPQQLPQPKPPAPTVDLALDDTTVTHRPQSLTCLPPWVHPDSTAPLTTLSKESGKLLPLPCLLPGDRVMSVGGRRVAPGGGGAAVLTEALQGLAPVAPPAPLAPEDPDEVSAAPVYDPSVLVVVRRVSSASRAAEGGPTRSAWAQAAGGGVALPAVRKAVVELLLLERQLLNFYPEPGARYAVAMACRLDTIALAGSAETLLAALGEEHRRLMEGLFLDLSDDHTKLPRFLLPFNRSSVRGGAPAAAAEAGAAAEGGDDEVIIID